MQRIEKYGSVEFTVPMIINHDDDLTIYNIPTFTEYYYESRGKLEGKGYTDKEIRSILENDYYKFYKEIFEYQKEMMEIDVPLDKEEEYYNHPELYIGENPTQNLLQSTYTPSLKRFDTMCNYYNLDKRIYGTSNGGQELIDFVLGDVNDPKAMHYWIVGNMGGNQQFSAEVLLKLAEKRTAEKIPEGVVYHFIPQPNPDKAIATEEGLKAVFSDKMNEAEVQAQALLYRAMEYLAAQTNPKVDYRAKFCNCEADERSKVITEILSEKEYTGKNGNKIPDIYNRLIQYPNQKIIMYNFLNDTKYPSDTNDKKILDEVNNFWNNSNEEMRKEVTNKFIEVNSRYNLPKSEHTPTSPELAHTNSGGYNGTTSVEQRALKEHIKKYENTGAILNITGPGASVYGVSKQNKLNLLLGTKRLEKFKRLNFKPKESKGNTLFDLFRNKGIGGEMAEFPVFTFETSPTGSTVAHSIDGRKKCDQVIDAIDETLDKTVDVTEKISDKMPLKDFNNIILDCFNTSCEHIERTVPDTIDDMIIKQYCKKTNSDENEAR